MWKRRDMPELLAPSADPAFEAGRGSPPPAAGEGVPAGPWIDATFADALAWGAATYDDGEAVVFGAQRLSFAQLASRVRAFARGLIALGVQPGDKVALWMADRPEWLVARWAVPMIGAVLVPVNTRFRDRDVLVVLAQSEATTLIVQDGARGTSYFDILAQVVPGMASHKRGAWSAQSLPALRRVIGLATVQQGLDGDADDDAAYPHATDDDATARKPAVAGPLPASMLRFEDIETCGTDHIVAAALASAPCAEAAQFVAEAACAAGSDKVLRARIDAVRPTDVAQILYTSGTTAFPKGAMVCHGALLQNNWFATTCLEMSTADRTLSCVPLFTATGTGCALATWLAGATMVIVDHLDPAWFCETVERERITACFFVDPVVQDLRAFGHLADYDLTSLRTGFGAPLTTASFLWITTTLGVSQLVSGYGLSETSNAVARTRVTDSLAKRSTTHGRPVEGVRIRIADVETDVTLPSGSVGEICIAGYVLMRGYYKQPEEDRKAIDAAGWLHSGDLGELDADGYLVYRGRVKEMIKPGGFSVATQEIEVFLKLFPGVREAAVVGVPDRRLGEVAYAFVETEPGASVQAEALRTWCKAHIASYKVPRFIEFVADWPLTGSQKIRKIELKVRAQAARARADALAAATARAAGEDPDVRR